MSSIAAATASQRVFWTLYALRSVRACKFDLLHRAECAYNDLKCNCEKGSQQHLVYLRNILQDQLALQLEEELSAAHQAYAQGFPALRRRVDSLNAWARRWSPKGRRVHVAAYQASDGTLCLEFDDIIAAIRHKWAPVFSDTRVDTDAAHFIPVNFSRPFPDFDPS